MARERNVEQISDDIFARDVAQQADPLDADVGGDAAALLGQTRTGRGEVGRAGTRGHARPQYWKVTVAPERFKL